MRTFTLTFLITLLSFFSYSQQKTIVSNLDNLSLSIGDSYTPITFVLDSDGKKADCNRMIYYNKRGVFSSAKSITVDNETGTITANEPGSHEVVAICFGEGGKRMSKTFNVNVKYPKVKEIKLSINASKIYSGTYIPISYEVIDEMGFKRNNVNFSLKSSNDILTIDDVNNVKAIASGSTTLEASFEGITGKINVEVLKNPVVNIEVESSSDQSRTGDVIQFNAKAYNKKGQEIMDIPFEYSFKGKSFDKSNTASGLISNDGKFVGDVAGNYLISASLGNISSSKALNVYDRNVKRDVVKVGTGLVNDKHTSDFWVFEGVDGRDYAVTGTWGADGTSYFWDVTDPASIKKIDSVKVDARTVNDVKVSEDGKICIISREGASNRKNGIIIIDVSNPYDVKIIKEYTQNLTGGVHNLFIYDNHVYALSAGRKYYILNIEDPKNPIEVGVFELGKEGQSIHDVWVEDGIAYSSNWRDGVYLVDVGNGVAGGSPSNPVAFGNYSYATGAHHMTFPFKSKSTGKFYTVLGDEIFPNGIDVNAPNETAGFLHFVDFTDPDNPEEVARYELPGHGSHNYWIEDDVLYVAMYSGGVRIVDISGDLMGDLYKQGREIGYILPGNKDGYIPFATMSWGAQLYKGHVFYSDWNSGLGAAKVMPIKPDNSKVNQYLN
ncbi:MAG: hypothetical protein VX499_03075 [Bacteroidota bacterium]|nr:hypothetical protein [Bacteroidota bacterium]|tara:strand:+ start:410 stop:2404 length:1995 start_codon:yes stop_codon:yes gene_type:complete